MARLPGVCDWMKSCHNRSYVYDIPFCYKSIVCLHQSQNYFALRNVVHISTKQLGTMERGDFMVFDVVAPHVLEQLAV